MAQVTGFITTIQRMSIHDGPGIRSTVFMKGCNLRCKWCHNPETWSSEPQLNYIQSKCLKCWNCIPECRSAALCAADGGVNIDRTACRNCGACSMACPSGALSVIGKRMDVEQTMKRITRDMNFYVESGGGVTLSGGEPLYQPEYALAILMACKRADLHTVVQSNIALEWTTIERFLDFTDLWLCDLKMADHSLHEQWTGVGNEKITANLRLLVQTGADVIVRSTIIPGVNDSDAEMERMCRMVAELGVRRYEINPFHTLGFGKYSALGIRNQMLHCTAADRVKIDRMKEIAHEYGLT